MKSYGFRIIDFHAHFPLQRENRSDLWRKRLIERYGEERASIFMTRSKKYRDEWRRRWGFMPPEDAHHSDEEQARRWVEDMDKKGVELVNFVMGGGNENLAKIVSWYPGRFTGFAHHPLFNKNAAQDLELAIKKLGLKGYKIIASAQTTPIDDKSAYQVWEVAAKLEIPIIIHFGALGGGGGPTYDLRNMNPLTLWEVASVFPDLKFVIPHFGALYLRELLQLCWGCPNILIDTSGSNQWLRWIPFEMSLKDLFRKCIESVGPDRIIFGSDSSYFPRGFAVRYLQDQIKVCYDIGLDRGSIEKIFHKNAARLLKL